MAIGCAEQRTILVADIRHSALYEISNEVETDLIDISSKLDELGFGAIGGLHFRLNRAAYYVREFRILLDTLQTNNIQSWISYEQFVQRGLDPAFHYMAGIGKRLRAVRERLLTTTETIETSVLVGQSAATRHNTAVLRNTTTLAILIPRFPRIERSDRLEPGGRSVHLRTSTAIRGEPYR